MACAGRLDMMRWGRFDSLVCVDWFSVWDLGHSDFSRYFDYDSWEACNFDSNFGINYEEDCGEWMFGRCVNGSALIGTFGWDSLSADVGFGRECGCGVQLVTLECRVGYGLWSRNVVHNGDTSIPDASIHFMLWLVLWGVEGVWRWNWGYGWLLLCERCV